LGNRACFVDFSSGLDRVSSLGNRSPIEHFT
jgi:hypothetical protein